MKKSYPFFELSEKKCSSCGRKLKRRLVEERRPKNIDKCYKCYVIAENLRGHEMKKV